MLKIPAGEKARSASTDVGGTVKRYEYTACRRHVPRFPLLLNKAISALIALRSCFSLAFPVEPAATEDGAIVDCSIALCSCCSNVRLDASPVSSPIVPCAVEVVAVYPVYLGVTCRFAVLPSMTELCRELVIDD